MRDILERCERLGLRMTGQRRVIAKVLSESDDHPDVNAIHRRARRVDSGISIATVYRALRLFEDVGILERLDFRGDKSRYEPADRDHHDHLIDLHTGEVMEFVSEEIEQLQSRVARGFGYRLVDHRLELYGVPLEAEDEANDGDPKR